MSVYQCDPQHAAAASESVKGEPRLVEWIMPHGLLIDD